MIDFGKLHASKRILNTDNCVEYVSFIKNWVGKGPATYWIEVRSDNGIYQVVASWSWMRKSERVSGEAARSHVVTNIDILKEAYVANIQAILDRDYEFYEHVTTTNSPIDPNFLASQFVQLLPITLHWAGPLVAVPNYPAQVGSYTVEEPTVNGGVLDDLTAVMNQPKYVFSAPVKLIDKLRRKGTKSWL